MNKRHVMMGAGLTVLGTIAGFGLKTVLAEGIPTPNPLYYSGTLSEAGTLVTGTRAITINLWADATAGSTPLCQTVASNAAVSSGRFRIALASACKAVINQNSGVYVEVIDGATSLGRIPVGAVPYAVEADHAVNATNAGHASTSDTATNAANAANATNATNAATAAGATAATFSVPNALTVGGNASVAGTLSVGIHASTNCTTFNVPAGNTWIDCSCGANELAIGGGAYSGGNGVFLDESRNGAPYPALGSTWRLGCQGASGRVSCYAPVAVCARLAP